MKGGEQIHLLYFYKGMKGNYLHFLSVAHNDSRLAFQKDWDVNTPLRSCTDEPRQLSNVDYKPFTHRLHYFEFFEVLTPLHKC